MQGLKLKWKLKSSLVRLRRLKQGQYFDKILQKNQRSWRKCSEANASTETALENNSPEEKDIEKQSGETNEANVMARAEAVHEEYAPEVTDTKRR